MFLNVLSHFAMWAQVSSTWFGPNEVILRSLACSIVVCEFCSHAMQCHTHLWEGLVCWVQENTSVLGRMSHYVWHSLRHYFQSACPLPLLLPLSSSCHSISSHGSIVSFPQSTPFPIHAPSWDQLSGADQHHVCTVFFILVVEIDSSTIWPLKRGNGR